MKRIIKLFLLLLTLNIGIVNAGSLKDGWHYVKLVDNPSDTCWAYYKNGVEKIRLKTIYYAHRGWATAPENSLAAFKEAKANGYYAFETDVRFTKDNVPVLSHDATINRVARNSDQSKLSKDVKVADSTLTELNKYSFSVTRTGEVLSKYKTNKITKFEDALVYAKENGMTIAIELKAGSKEQIASLVKLVKKYNMDNVVKWISFQKKLLLYVNEAEDDEIVGIIANKQTEEELKQIRNELKTKNNVVIGLDIKGHNNTPNVPEDASKYKQSSQNLSTIPRATLKLSESSINLAINTTVTKSYTYNGDGNITCKSSDSKVATCTIDKSKKTITISSLKASSSPVTITLDGSQGVKYSAPAASKLEVKVGLLDLVLNLSDINTPYTGSSQNIKASVKKVNNQNYNGKITYYYYANTSCSGTKLSSEPYNVGNYSVQAYGTSAGNYKSGKSRCAKLTIMKASPTLTVEESTIKTDQESTTINYTYNGDGTLECMSNNENLSCTIDENNKTITVTSSLPTTGVVTLRATSGTNYTESRATISVKNEGILGINIDLLIYITAGLGIFLLLIFILIKIFGKK